MSVTDSLVGTPTDFLLLPQPATPIDTNAIVISARFTAILLCKTNPD
jgi:hypothetical protein